MTPGSGNWSATDKGRRVALILLRWYGIILVGGIVLAFAAGIGAGWWLCGLLHLDLLRVPVW